MATLKEKMGHMLGRMRAGQDTAGFDVTRREDDPAQRKEATLAQIKEGYGEIVETMQALRVHLDDTQQRQAQMARMMGGLPEVLRTLPEATRTQTQLIKAIGAHLESQNTTNGHLTEAIQGLGKSADRQDETLGTIRDHLTEEAGTRRELNTGVLALNSTLESVEASNLAAQDALSAAQAQSQRSEERMAEMYRKGQRFNAVMLFLSAVMMAAAVGVVVWLLVKDGAVGG